MLALLDRRIQGCKKVKISLRRKINGGDYKLSVMPGGWLVYRYKCHLHDMDTECEFTLLSEVGDAYQPVFEDMLAVLTSKGYTVQKMEFDGPPHYADCLVKAKTS